MGRRMARTETLSYVTDTHALFWYLTASPRLGQQAKQAFDKGARGEAILYVPVIVLAELFFLNEKMGRPLDFKQEYARLEQSGQFIFVGIQPQDILDLAENNVVAEMHDRFIVGVARRLNVACLTRDENIRMSNLIQIVW